MPDRITLTGSQRRALKRLVRAGRTEQRLVTRAGIVLAAAEGQPNARIAASLRVCEDTVRKWRHRWCGAPGLASLPTRPALVAARHSLLCRSPRSRRWPARHRARRGCRCRGGRARNWRTRPSPAGSARRSHPPRCADGCRRTPKPWQHRSWIFITDPDFAAKAGACSTSTTEPGTENRWATTTM